MPTRKSRRRRIGGWGPGHRSQLMFGWDFFSDGWGVSRLAIEAGDVGIEIIDDMRRAWEHFREDVLAAWASRPRVHPRPWAARFFEPEGEAVEALELVEV